jgi:addiction module RelB/DinJ family antitoxin
MGTNTTSLHIKIDSDLKRHAQQTARELGLSLSAVVKALLKEFIRIKRLSVSASDLPEISDIERRRGIIENERQKAI